MLLKTSCSTSWPVGALTGSFSSSPSEAMPSRDERDARELVLEVVIISA